MQHWFIFFRCPSFIFVYILFHFLLFQTLVNFSFLSVFQKQKNSSQVCHLIRGLYNSKVANYKRTEILISKVGTVCVDLAGYHGLNEFSPSRHCKPEVHITILECSTIVYTFKLCCLKKVILNEGKGRMLKTAFRSILIKDQVWRSA